MTAARSRLPNRHYREGFDFEHRGTVFTACIGRDIDQRGRGDGSIRELFLSTTKAGTDVDGDARDLALLFSLLIQHGAPIATIRAALTKRQDGHPAGVLGRALELIGEGT